MLCLRAQICACMQPGHRHAAPSRREGPGLLPLLALAAAEGKWLSPGLSCFIFSLLHKQGQTWRWLQKPSWLQQRTFGTKLALATKKQHPQVARWEVVMDRHCTNAGRKLKEVCSRQGTPSAQTRECLVQEKLQILIMSLTRKLQPLAQRSGAWLIAAVFLAHTPPFSPCFDS